MPGFGFTYGLSTRGYGERNGAKERNLCEGATVGRLVMRQIGGDIWLTGDVASAHAVIAKKRRITVTIRVYRMLPKDV